MLAIRSGSQFLLIPEGLEWVDVQSSDTGSMDDFHETGLTETEEGPFPNGFQAS